MLCIESGASSRRRRACFRSGMVWYEYSNERKSYVLAYPGRVETIEGAHGIVNFSGNKVRVNLSMVSVETGDYVLSMQAWRYRKWKERSP
ncbi:MAG: HypC/HybG/HupF family hydrogenase formation chaperone [Dialister invisus]